MVALQTNLIAASSHAEEAREWFYWKPQAAGGTTAGTAGGTAGAIAGTAGQPQAGTEEGRVGPVSKVEVRQLYRCAGACFGVVCALFARHQSAAVWCLVWNLCCA